MESNIEMLITYIYFFGFVNGHCIDIDSGDEPTRRPTRGILKLYYGLHEQGGSQPIDPLDIDSNQFKVESYLSKQLRENGLQQLMEKETEMVKR